ncbi:uracil DNA N-glycosylase Thp1 [Coemansia sp. RSA 2610]|nr:uracil DNA N-glycosylase Thp1 [Coemansia sp. RSA 2610]
MPKARKSSPPATPKRRSQARRQPTAQELSELAPIPETLRPGLDVLFVGINPGVVSGQKQLHFGNPQNYFWKGLFESELIPEAVRPEDGHRLSAEWNMSIVNLVQRTTPSTSDLSRHEMRAAVPELCRKITSNPPRVVCFVGKGIYEAFVGHTGFALGLQDDVYDLGAELETQPEHLPPLRRPDSPSDAPFAYLFVMPSTSGRTAAYQNPEKRQYFCQLKYVRDCAARQPDAAPIDHARLAALGPQVRSRYFKRQ